MEATGQQAPPGDTPGQRKKKGKFGFRCHATPIDKNGFERLPGKKPPGKKPPKKFFMDHINPHSYGDQLIVLEDKLWKLKSFPDVALTEVDASAATGQGEVVKRVTFDWKPGKGVEDSAVEEDELILEDIKNLELYAEDLEGYSVPSDTAFPENLPITHYEAEDWDKELEESEYNNKPYGKQLLRTVVGDGLGSVRHQIKYDKRDSDDVIFCGNVQDWNPVALCSVQEEPLYDPSTHHVAPVIWKHQNTRPVDGQFDDAVD